jgi:hypothetical protein
MIPEAMDAWQRWHRDAKDADRIRLMNKIEAYLKMTNNEFATFEEIATLAFTWGFKIN